MFKKIIILLMLSLMFIGVASAVENTDFTAPDDFEDVGDGVYVLYDSLKNPDLILSVVSYTEHDADDYIANDTENNYTVIEGENNTYNFVDGSTGEKGTFELIEVDGVKFIVDFAKRGIGDETDFNETFNRLMEFNQLNNVNATKWV